MFAVLRARYSLLGNSLGVQESSEKHTTTQVLTRAWAGAQGNGLLRV